MLGCRSSLSSCIHLVVDNSNSRTKFALGGATAPSKLGQWRGVLPTAEVTAESLADLLCDLTFQSATICSVVPEKRKVLADFFSEKGIPCHLASAASKLPIGIDYPKPTQIGPDRLANAAALAPISQPTVVVDFGTAVTFDVISPQNGGTYQGGVIAPGLGALCEGLQRRTALLPKIELAEPASAIGKSTEHAMQVGALIGYRGLIRGILTALEEELGAPLHVVATGGDAPLLCDPMPEIHAVDPDLTLKGILAIAILNRA